ncbi:hypothetical protein BD408DRAFT_415852 [Parasitella parasitica]|nr:hypothetical protein BD408DRAFT_415852 [Parasitella parasitica]
MKLRRGRNIAVKKQEDPSPAWPVTDSSTVASIFDNAVYVDNSSDHQVDRMIHKSLNIKEEEIDELLEYSSRESSAAKDCVFLTHKIKSIEHTPDFEYHTDMEESQDKEAEVEDGEEVWEEDEAKKEAIEINFKIEQIDKFLSIEKEKQEAVVDLKRKTTDSQTDMEPEEGILEAGLKQETSRNNADTAEDDQSVEIYLNLDKSQCSTHIDKEEGEEETDIAEENQIRFKREETEKPTSILSVHAAPNNNRGDGDLAYYYTCKKCNVEETTYLSYLEHRKTAHSISHKERERKIKHHGLEPSVNDPNFYCRSCEESHENRRKYRQHLRAIHHMVLKPLIEKTKKQINTEEVPDPEDPNHYCRVCRITSATIQDYRAHLKDVHHIITTPFKRKILDVTPDVDDPNFRCCACNISYKTKTRYHSHLRIRHEPYVVGPAANHALKPNPDDPNNYCLPCDMKFLCRKWYKNHLKSRHKIKVFNFDVLPDFNDPDNYCKACNYRFSTIKGFEMHCIQIHKLDSDGDIREPTNTKAELPDPDDPNFYCRVCRKSNSNKTNHRYHCRAVHDMVLPSLYVGPNANPDLIPDPLDLNNYCRTCDKTYTKRHIYVMHLRRVHIMSQLPSFKTLKKQSSPTDPSSHPYYCNICHKILSTCSYFRKHMVLMHKTEAPLPPKRPKKTRERPNKSQLQPDVNDPNFYCRSCDYKHASRSTYRVHLLTEHSLDLAYERKRKALEPNFYCMICKKSTTEDYRKHRYHCREDSMPLIRRRKTEILFPDAKIDLSHPDFYCAKCDRKFAHRPSLQSHVRKVHKSK